MRDISFEDNIKIYFAIIVISTLGIYSISLFENASFFWDDKWMLTENPQIQFVELSDLLDIFLKPYFSQYSPLNTIVYLVIYRLFGLDPFIYHLTFVLLHIINALLIFKIIYKIYQIKNRQNDSVINNEKNALIAFLVALLFAIGPMQIESVAWISASKIILYSFFYFMAIIYYLNYVEHDRKHTLVISLTFFLLSFFCKEQAVILPASILMIAYLIYPKLNRRCILPIIPFFVFGISLGIVSIVIQSQGFSEMLNVYYPFWQRCFLACYSITQYGVKILLPIRQWLFYPFPLHPGDPLPLLYWIYPVILAVLAYCLFYFFKSGQKLIIFGFFFFLFNLALTLHIIPMGRLSVIADRYTYISCVGLYLILVDYAVKLWTTREIHRVYIILFLTIYISLTITKSVIYIKKWDHYWQSKTE